VGGSALLGGSIALRLGGSASPEACRVGFWGWWLVMVTLGGIFFGVFHNVCCGRLGLG
jgi:hypothetical protein